VATLEDEGKEDEGKELYRVTIVVKAPTMEVTCREYIEARGFNDAEREALLAVDRRWRYGHEPERYEVREVERGAFQRAQ
jgi:hypothetical protein